MREIVVVGFAGGGGSSTGIKMATGADPEVAINHDESALAMHRANHPGTLHVRSNIWRVDPDEVAPGRPIGLAWFSPDCVDHSKAKGGMPVRRHVRDLGWIPVLWAQRRRPRIIMIENVEEFEQWSPVIYDADGSGRRDPERRGETFGRMVGAMRREGYRGEWRTIRAYRHGAPTLRNRLYMVFRRDGQPIAWPDPTHGDPRASGGGLLPWRTAADVIDWSLPCPSIFMTREEARAYFEATGVRVNRPLADATMARIARGVWRYVLTAAVPFVVGVGSRAGQSPERPAEAPLGTVTATKRGQHALVTPFLVPTTHSGDARVNGAEEPLRTVTTAHRGEHALVTPFLARQFGASVGAGPDDPAPTVMPNGGGKTALIAPLLTRYNGPGRGGQDRAGAPDVPAGTITTENRHALVAAFLAQHNRGSVGHQAGEPLSTITGRGTQQAVVSAGLVSLHGAERRGQGIEEPVPGLTAGGTHVAELRAFLLKYFGTDQDPRLEEPLHTATARARFGLVLVEGELHQVVDVGMRMLTPRELFLAQGFPQGYVIDRGLYEDGWRPLTKTDQVRMAGNSVCPPVAAALVAANYRALDVQADAVPPFGMSAAE